MSQPVPWGLDEAGSPVQGEMGLSFFDITCRKSVKDGETRNICPKKGNRTDQQMLLTNLEMIQTPRWVESLPSFPFPCSLQAMLQPMSLRRKPKGPFLTEEAL